MGVSERAWSHNDPRPGHPEPRFEIIELFWNRMNISLTKNLHFFSKVFSSNIKSRSDIEKNK